MATVCGGSLALFDAGIHIRTSYSPPYKPAMINTIMLSVVCCFIPISGVPMPHAVAGVACGLFSRTKPDSVDIDQYQILTDINVRPMQLPYIP